MSNFIDKLIAFEEGTLDELEAIELLQQMVDDGSVWSLQGTYGRLAWELLEAGVLRFPEIRTSDYYGTPLPTRAEWERESGAGRRVDAEPDAAKEQPTEITEA